MPCSCACCSFPLKRLPRMFPSVELLSFKTHFDQQHFLGEGVLVRPANRPTTAAQHPTVCCKALRDTQRDLILPRDKDQKRLPGGRGVPAEAQRTDRQRAVGTAPGQREPCVQRPGIQRKPSGCKEFESRAGALADHATCRPPV